MGTNTDTLSDVIAGSAKVVGDVPAGSAKVVGEFRGVVLTQWSTHDVIEWDDESCRLVWCSAVSRLIWFCLSMR